MKNSIPFTMLIAVVAILIISSSCRKNDMLTELANEAHPDITAHVNEDDTSGFWIAKTKICFVTEP